MTLQEEYTKEKHAVPQFEGYFSQDYTLWLENKIEQQRISDTPVLSAVPSDEKLTLNDLDGKTILVKFSVQKGKLKVYPEEFDLE